MTGTGDGTIESNKGEIKFIVRTLGICLGGCVLGLFGLIFYDKKIPTELWLLTSNLATALVSMLVKTSATATTSSSPPDKSAGTIDVAAQKLETTQTS